MRLPDAFQDQDKPEKQYAEAGLDADAIVETVLKALRHNSAGVDRGRARLAPSDIVYRPNKCSCAASVALIASTCALLTRA